MMLGVSPKWLEATIRKKHIESLEKEAFEAGFKAGQVCGNGLSVAYKEFKHKDEKS